MDGCNSKKEGRRSLTEEVIQVIKRARLGPSPRENTTFWKKRYARDSSSEEDSSPVVPEADPRRVKRRIEEKVATKVARALDEFSGAANMQSKFLEARDAEVANARLEALETEILPELRKIEASHTEECSLSSSSSRAGLERQLLEASRGREAAEGELEEELRRRRELQTKLFFAERELENWKGLSLALAKESAFGGEIQPVRGPLTYW